MHRLVGDGPWQIGGRVDAVVRAERTGSIVDVEGFTVGMNFDLTAEQAAFRGVVREFANEVVAPRSAEADLEEKLPLDVVKQMGELGLFGLPFPAA